MSVTVRELNDEPGATALLSEFKDNTDPKYIGPGTWNVLHRRAFSARTRPAELAFIDLMREICEKFPCKTCSGHCQEYMTNHPLEEYLGVILEIENEKISLGMFIWTWKFHNAVNSRIGKPIMSWETAYNLYSTGGESLVCSKNCTDAGVDLGELAESPPEMLHDVESLKKTVPSPKSMRPFRFIASTMNYRR